jgi:hypothetical protein
MVYFALGKEMAATRDQQANCLDYRIPVTTPRTCMLLLMTRQECMGNKDGGNAASDGIR